MGTNGGGGVCSIPGSRGSALGPGNPGWINPRELIGGSWGWGVGVVHDTMLVI